MFSVFATVLLVALLGVLVWLGLGVRNERTAQARLTELAQATAGVAGCATLGHPSSTVWWRCLGWQQAFLSAYQLVPREGIDQTAALWQIVRTHPNAPTDVQGLTPADYARIQDEQLQQIRRLGTSSDTLLEWLLALSGGLGGVLGVGLLALTLWRARQATRRRLELEAHQLMLSQASLNWHSTDYQPWLERLCQSVGARTLTLWRMRDGRRLVGHAGLGVALTDWQTPATAEHEIAVTRQGRALLMGMGVLDTPLVLVATFRSRAPEGAAQALGKLGSALTASLNRQLLLERLALEVDLNSAMTGVSRLLAEPIGPPELLRAALDVLIDHARLRPLRPEEEDEDPDAAWAWLAPVAEAALAARGHQAAAFTTVSLNTDTDSLLGVVWRLPGHSGHMLFDWDGHDEAGLAVLARHVERTLGAAVERHGLLAELQEAALWDSLTQVRNRRAFDADLSRRVQSRRVGERGFALAILDLDGFKAVNDLHGHERGDELLRRFAHYLRQTIREEDLLYRLGGDEFAVVLNGVRPETVPTVEARLRAFADSLLGGAFAGVTVSVGSASFPDEAALPGELQHLADQRMYEDKRRRRHLRPVRGGQGESLSH